MQSAIGKSNETAYSDVVFRYPTKTLEVEISAVQASLNESALATSINP
jgi:hypothetical protein